MTKSPKYSEAKTGGKNPHAHLTAKQVRAIKSYARSPDPPYGWQSALARKYNVTAACIHDIIAGRRWQHID